MDGGFSYGDIIVIGAIAVFILLRYRAMLGERSEDDPSARSKIAPLADYERVVQLPVQRRAETPEKKDDLARFGALGETLGRMRGVDREFSAEEFLQGARAAYEMIIEAYTKADRDTLKMLLSASLYAEFEAALADEAAQQRKVETTLVAINKAELAAATLEGATAELAVDFASEQIHLVRGEHGEIIEGDPSAPVTVEERWRFTRDLSQPNPNWQIIATS